MSLQLIDIQRDGSKVTVVLEGKSFEEVASPDAKRTALAEASKLVGLCGISATTGPYPVDQDGKEVQDATKFAEAVRNGGYSVFKYRNDFVVQQSLGL